LLKEVVLAFGHVNVTSTNRTTFEITGESHLSKEGDCIIAVSANKGLTDFDTGFKERIRNGKTAVMIRIEADGEVDVVRAFGSPFLTLSHKTDVVVRKSDFVSDRTLAVQADKAACDLSRKLVEKLRDPNQKVKITFTLDV
jgi:hypothetical protein